jgi:hypothetical protein
VSFVRGDWVVVVGGHSVLVGRVGKVTGNTLIGPLYTSVAVVGSPKLELWHRLRNLRLATPAEIQAAQLGQLAEAGL